MNTKYKYLGFAFLLITSTGCKSPVQTSHSQKLEHDGSIVATIEQGQQFFLMLAKPDGLVTYKGPTGKISVGCRAGRAPNILNELVSGPYSVILDEDGDGLPEIGVERNTGDKVKFSIEVKK